MSVVVVFVCVFVVVVVVVVFVCVCQSWFSHVLVASHCSPRVKFMLEILSALKTNNSRKIPNYDPSVLEHMKKLLRSLLRSSGG